MGAINNGRYSAREIKSLVLEGDAQVYAMSIFEPSIFLGLSNEEVSGPHLLSELAEQTGGRAFSASDPDDLPSVAASIGIELRKPVCSGILPKEPEKGWEIPSS